MKHALIINGDTESRHLNNVDKAAWSLSAAGYSVMAISPHRPKVPVDRYVPAEWQKITPFMNSLPAELKPEDDLVIYSTGHGSIELGRGATFSGEICIDHDCRSQEWERWLNKLPYHQRVVVMDQCYSGNWRRPMLSQSRTLFISAGSENETDVCQEFAPPFWQDANVYIPTWSERFEKVFTVHPAFSKPYFMASADYVFDTPPPFPNHVVTVTTKEEMDARGKTLKPGQNAVIMFSAPWCHFCKEYSPKFEAFAKETGGRYLFIKTDNEALAAAAGISSFPTIVVLNGTGGIEFLDPNDRDHLAQAITNASLSPSSKLTMVVGEQEPMGMGRFFVGFAESVFSNVGIPILVAKLTQQLSINRLYRIGDISDRFSSHIVENLTATIERGCAEGKTAKDILKSLEKTSWFRESPPKTAIGTLFIGGFIFSLIVDGSTFATDTYHANALLMDWMGGDSFISKKALMMGAVYMLARFISDRRSSPLQFARFLAAVVRHSLQQRAFSEVRHRAASGVNRCSPELLSELETAIYPQPAAVATLRVTATHSNHDMWETIALGATAAVATVTLAAAIAEDFFPAAGGPANDAPALTFFGASWRMYLARF